MKKVKARKPLEAKRPAKTKAVAAGVRRRLSGEKHPRAKLADKDIKAIRKSYKTGKVTQTDLAKHYEVSVTYMHKIVNNLARV